MLDEAARLGRGPACRFDRANAHRFKGGTVKLVGVGSIARSHSFILRNCYYFNLGEYLIVGLLGGKLLPAFKKNSKTFGLICDDCCWKGFIGWNDVVLDAACI